MAEKKMPFAIASLENPAKAKHWVQRRHERGRLYGDSWTEEGTHNFTESLERKFGLGLVAHCEQYLQTHRGRLLMTSFGGGRLHDIVGLRAFLIQRAEELGLPADIKVVDFSLTKRLGREGLLKLGLEELLKNGTVALYSGPAELRKLDAAQGSGVMISSFGPFFHAVNKREPMELAAKAAPLLGHGGRAFFHATWQSLAHLPELKKILGPEYRVVQGEEREGATMFFDIERL